MGRPIDVLALVEGVVAGRRADVSRAITLVESSRVDHRAAARELLTSLAVAEHPPATRVGISGVPGVGKSTFIETLGTRLTAAGHRVGVLAVEQVGDVLDLLAQRLGVEALLQVVGDLDGPPPRGLVDGLFHRGRDLVGIHVDLAGDVASGTTDGLDQAAGTAQEPLLVGVQDAHQRDLGQV